MESQKHSVAGDEITVPGATEKVSFNTQQLKYLQYTLKS